MAKKNKSLALIQTSHMGAEKLGKAIAKDLEKYVFYGEPSIDIYKKVLPIMKDGIGEYYCCSLDEISGK